MQGLPLDIFHHVLNIQSLYKLCSFGEFSFVKDTATLLGFKLIAIFQLSLFFVFFI